MNDLAAAIWTACTMLLCAHILAGALERVGWSWSRLVKYMSVSVRQMTADERQAGALFVCVMALLLLRAADATSAKDEQLARRFGWDLVDARGSSLDIAGKEA